MGMAGILFNGAEPFDQIVRIFFNRRPYVKSNENCSRGFREEGFKDFTILYMYIAKGQRQITPKILMVSKQFNFLIIHGKFQFLVFYTY